MDIQNDLGKLKDLVGMSAPLLGRVLSGPYYAVAVDLISKLLGADGRVSDILAKISATSNVVDSLKSVEDAHCEILEKLANDAFAQEANDRQDARKRERELHDFVPTVLALGFLFIYAFFQFYVAVHAQTTSNEMIIARLQDGLMYILAYYFGGMHKKKDDAHG